MRYASQKAIFTCTVVLVSVSLHAQDYSGFTSRETRKFHRLIRTDLDASFHDGGAISHYIWLNMSEFWPHSVIHRSGSVRMLPMSPRENVANVVTQTKVGKLPLLDYVNRSTVDGAIILHRGRIVFENYPRMFPYDKHIYMSVTEVFPATCVAILEDRNLIDVSKPIDAYFSELKGSNWEGIKVIDILDMASGMNFFRIARPGHPEPDGSHDRYMQAFGFTTQENAKENLLESLKTIRSHRPAGQLFEYSNINTFVLTMLVERVSGFTFARFLEQEIWQPMGAESDALLLNGAYGRAATPLGLSSSLRDLARFGLLFTPSGRKKKYNVISDVYLKKIQKGGRPELNNPEDLDLLGEEAPRHCACQWDRVMEDGDFYKEGFGGQGLYVSPDRDLVIAFFGAFGKDKIYHELPLICRQLVKSGLFN